ncbi:hypothetical protein TNCV_3824851 [Trichonephila clavipes]|nr:hypothetical protein TNCV_3824851 [Trichonephila clavipes]
MAYGGTTCKLVQLVGPVVEVHPTRFRFTYDPAYKAKDRCYGQKGQFQYPSKPVSTAVTPKCNHRLNSTRDSGRYAGLSAKRCSKGMDVFGVKSLTDVKGNNPPPLYLFA